MSANNLQEIPAKVSLAIKLFYLVVGTGVLRTVLTAVRHADVRSPHFYLATKSLLYLFSLFLIYQVSKGKNWARWALVAILLLSTPLTVLPIFDSFAHSPLNSVLGLLQLAVALAAFSLLFQKQHLAWFTPGKGTENR